MTTNKPESPTEVVNLSVVKKVDLEIQHAKLVAIKKIEFKAPMLLPPPAEKYIKPKKHDFF